LNLAFCLRVAINLGTLSASDPPPKVPFAGKTLLSWKAVVPRIEEEIFMEQLVIDGANYEAETGERLIGSRFLSHAWA
jgi:hypothetical protein